MTVREFNGTTDFIQTSPGGVPNTAPGNKTFVVVVKRITNSGGTHDALIGLNATTPVDVNAGFFFGDPGLSDCIGLFNDGTGAISRSTTITVLAADGWCLAAAGKASGNATPRFHKFQYSTQVWSHEDGNAAIGDGTFTGFSSCEIGAWVGGFDGSNARIIVAGIFPGNLSDADVESLKDGLQGWLNLNPQACWPLNQLAVATPILDASATGTADQSAITGTTTVGSDDPPFTPDLITGLPPNPALFIERGLWRPWRGTDAVPAGGTVFTADLTGALTPAGGLVLATSKPLAGAVTPTGTLAKLDSKPLAGAITPSGALAKLVGKPLAGGITPTGALATAKVILIALAGAITPTGTIARQTGKALAGTLTSGGTLVRRTGKGLAGVLGPTGGLAKHISKPFQGMLTTAGVLALVLNPLQVPPPRWVESGSGSGTLIEPGGGSGGGIEAGGGSSGRIEGGGGV